MPLPVVKEGTTAYLTVEFLDRNGDAEAPASVSYRVDCLTTGTQVRGDTAIGAAASIEITLTPSDMAIVDATNAKERKRITVEGTYGGDDGVNDQYDLVVRNLSASP